MLLCTYCIIHLWLLLRVSFHDWVWATWLRLHILTFLYVSYTWGSLHFLDLWVYTVHKFGKVSAIISSQIFFSSPLLVQRLELHVNYTAWRYPTSHWCSVHSFYFSFLFVSFWVVSMAIFSSSLVFSSATLNLLLIPLIVFFICTLYFSSLECRFETFFYIRHWGSHHILWPQSDFQMSVVPPNILTIIS